LVNHVTSTVCTYIAALHSYYASATSSWTFHFLVISLDALNIKELICLSADDGERETTMKSLL